VQTISKQIKNWFCAHKEKYRRLSQRLQSVLE
jgi:hypothetical protein